jgi:multiple sugar transport system substrate-binding protein
MRKCKSLLLLILAVVMVSSLFAGCGAAPAATQATSDQVTKAETSAVAATATVAPAEKKTISWATWCLSEEALKPTYVAMAQTFMDANPNVTIDYVTYPYAQYKDQMVIAAAANNAPDIAHVKAEWMPALLNLGTLQPLDDVLSSDLKSDYFESIIAGATVDGKIMSAPWFNSPFALYYNKTLLQKAGITELPKTWTELMADAKKISALGKDASGNKIYGYAVPSSKAEPGFGYNFFPHMWVHGGQFSDANGNITIYSPENVAAFTEAKELFTGEISPNGATVRDLRNLFAQGTIGFFYDLEMAQGPIAEASPKGKDFAKEYSVMVIPGATDPNGPGYITEHQLAVFKTSKNLDAISAFIDHLTGPVVLKILYDANMGKMPDRKSVTKLDIFTAPKNEITKIFVASLPSAHALPTSGEAFMQADEAFADALAKLSVSKDSVDKIVKDLDAKVKELYSQK